MKVLVIAPHPDDEVLGMGATMAKMIAEGHEVHVCVVTRGKPPQYGDRMIEETIRGQEKAHKLLGGISCKRLNFPTLQITPLAAAALNNAISEVVREVKPEELYIPHHGDMHSEHRMISEACLVAARPKDGCTVKRIYEYEVLSETGWNCPNAGNDFIPTVYVDVSKICGRKIEALTMFTHQVQEPPNARSAYAVSALLHFRGACIGVWSAEAFSLVREIK